MVRLGQTVGETGSSWLANAVFGCLANVLQTPYRRQTRALAGCDRTYAITDVRVSRYPDLASAPGGKEQSTEVLPRLSKLVPSTTAARRRRASFETKAAAGNAAVHSPCDTASVAAPLAYKLRVRHGECERGRKRGSTSAFSMGCSFRRIPTRLPVPVPAQGSVRLRFRTRCAARPAA